MSSIFATITKGLVQGAAESLNNAIAQSAGSSTPRTKRKGGCSPCAARAQQAAIQQKLGVKGWYGK